MNKLKVTIVYELYNRENINVALLSYEMKKRGYEVSVKSKSEEIGLKACDILVIPNCYNTENYNYYVYRFNCPSQNIVNLQVEQVWNDDEEEIGHEFLASGLAKKTQFICWGNDRARRLKKIGVTADKINIVGAMHTDALKGNLKRLWKKRSVIAKEFNLDEEKKWVLFISSLTYACDEDAPLYIANKKYDHIRDEHENQTKLQIEYLNWFSKLIEDQNVLLLYRPHPTEVTSQRLRKMEKKYEGKFHIISRYNLKQWLVVSDVITMWESTSLIECFYSKKPTFILRPSDIQFAHNYFIFKDANKISTRDEFLSAVSECESFHFPAHEENLMDCYNLSDEYIFPRICDVIENVGKEKKKGNRSFLFRRINYITRKHFVSKIVVKRIYQFLKSKFGMDLKKVFKNLFMYEWESYIGEKENFRKLEEKIFQLLKNENY